MLDMVTGVVESATDDTPESEVVKVVDGVGWTTVLGTPEEEATAEEVGVVVIAVADTADAADAEAAEAEAADCSEA